MLEPFNFLEIANAQGYSPICSGMRFIPGDTFIDYYRKPINQTLIYDLVLVRADLGTDVLNFGSSAISFPSANVFKLEFSFPLTGSGSLGRFYLEVRNGANAVFRSDEFQVNQVWDIETNLVRFAFDCEPGDEIELRLPMQIGFPQPLEEGADFNTFVEDIFRVRKIRQLEFEFTLNENNKELQIKVFRALVQKFFTFLWEDGFYYDAIFEKDYEITYDKNIFSSTGKQQDATGKLKVNTRSESNNIESITGDVYFKANYLQMIVSEALPGLVDVKLVSDIPVNVPIQIDYQVQPIGGSPALPADFIGGVYPSGSITFGALSMEESLSFTTANIVRLDVNYEIEYTCTLFNSVVVQKTGLLPTQDEFFAVLNWLAGSGVDTDAILCSITNISNFTDFSQIGARSDLSGITKEIQGNFNDSPIYSLKAQNTKLNSESSFSSVNILVDQVSNLFFSTAVFSEVNPGTNSIQLTWNPATRTLPNDTNADILFFVIENISTTDKIFGFYTGVNAGSGSYTNLSAPKYGFTGNNIRVIWGFLSSSLVLISPINTQTFAIT